MSRALRAVIFDFDGVIADTEPLHLRAFQKVFAEEGVTLTEKKYYETYLGMDDKGCFTAVLSVHGRSPTRKEIESLIRRKSRRYMGAVSRGLSFIPGAISFVKNASRRYPLAIVSGALRREIVAILKEGGIDREFSVIVSAEDIQNGKPDPEGFVTALKRFNREKKLRHYMKPPLNSRECLVVEDSPFGIDAALRAGMPCLALSTSYPSRDLAKAHIVKRNFIGLTPSFLEKYFSTRRPGTAP